MRKSRNKSGSRFVSLINIKKIVLPNRSGFELTISTLVIIVLAMMVLAVLIFAFTGGFKNFWETLKGYFGSDIDNVSKICQSQCDLAREEDFCCQEKLLGKEKITCLDSRLEVECNINCENAC